MEFNIKIVIIIATIQVQSLDRYEIKFLVHIDPNKTRKMVVSYITK